MTNILFVTDTRRDNHSVANRVAAHLLESLHAHRSHVRFSIRDLACNPLPFAGDNFVRCMQQGRKLCGSNTVAPACLGRLLEEVRQSDIIVISVSMKDFKVPLHFKTWADALFYAAHSSAANGMDPCSVFFGKRIYLVVDRTRGSDIVQPAIADLRFPYLQGALNMMGAANLRVVDLKGTLSCEEEARKTIASGVRSALKLAGGAGGQSSGRDSPLQIASIS